MWYWETIDRQKYTAATSLSIINFVLSLNNYTFVESDTKSMKYRVQGPLMASYYTAIAIMKC